MKSFFWREVVKDSKMVMALAIPIILSTVVTAALAITDSYFLSRLGSPVPLAGYGLTATFMVVFYAVIYGFLSPLLTMVGQAAAAGDDKKVGAIVRVGCLLAARAGLLAGVILFACYFLLPLLGEPVEVVSAMFGYWLCVCGSVALYALGMVLKQTLDALRKPWTAMVIYCSMVVVNLPLAYIFVFGVSGVVPGFGLTGTGFAWLAADSTATGLLFLYFLFHPSMKKYHAVKKNADGRARLKWFLTAKLDKKIMKHFLRASAPIVIESFFGVVSYASIGVMIGWFGVQALAARQISNGFSEMLYMIPLSMTYATTIVISNIFGEKKFNRLRIAGVASLMTVACFALLSILFLLLFGHDIATLFGKDLADADVIVPLAAGFLLLGAAVQIVDGFQSTMLGALRGIGDFTFSSAVSSIGFMVVGMPLAYVFGFHVFHHPLGIIAGFEIGVLVIGVVLAVRFWHKTNFKRA